MKIAFTSSGKTWDAQIDPRFGRAEFLILFDEETDEMQVTSNQDVQSVAHGAGPKTAQKLYELAPDVLITGNGPGGNAMSILSHSKIEIYVGAAGKTIREAYQAYKDNELVSANT
jgi:predicted Fe-Mo cluster-binding NifX family protein